ncbi:putative RNA polymerase sigma factor [Luteimicrobium album]|uniref:RNA polymerase sigma factor n=1 Tax=Luteimicrobium album TaxID=1054550 RepID=A0ABQ6I0B0_9MICO|nr:sigma-70 family RNA polymerase sigma factor [Luteimicrobium album]GMA23224.1 putative RNA polymerase sigma factor [Luteimicrobium album]
MSDLRHSPAHEAEADDELARRARLGDKRAFADLVDRHGPVVHRFAARLVGPDEADDVAQETFVTAWTSLDRYRGASAFRTWLLGIAANHARHRLRWDARHPRGPLPDPDEPATVLGAHDAGPDRRAIGDAFVDALEKALDELPVMQRACWILRDVEGLSYAEVAEVQATTVTAVRGALHRARTALASRLEPWR